MNDIHNNFFRAIDRAWLNKHFHKKTTTLEVTKSILELTESTTSAKTVPRHHIFLHELRIFTDLFGYLARHPYSSNVLSTISSHGVSSR